MPFSPIPTSPTRGTTGPVCASQHGYDQLEIDPERLRDFRVERKLDELDLTWKLVPALPLARIDAVRGQQNQARPTGAPLNPETVKRYREAYRNGDSFPPICVEKRTTKNTSAKRPYVPLDGLHRIEVLTIEGAETTPAYEVDGDITAMQLFTMAVNNLNGQPLTRAERQLHATYMLDRGVDPDRVAELTQLSAGIIQKIRARRQAATRALEAGISPEQWDALQPTIRDVLSQVVTNEGMFALYKFYMKTYLPADVMRRIVGELNTTRTGKKQEKFVSEDLPALYAQEIADASTLAQPGRGKRRGASDPATRLKIVVGSMGTMAKVQGFDWVAQVSDPVTLDSYYERVKAVRAFADSLEAAIDAARKDAGT